MCVHVAKKLKDVMADEAPATPTPTGEGTPVEKKLTAKEVRAAAPHGSLTGGRLGTGYHALWGPPSDGLLPPRCDGGLGGGAPGGRRCSIEQCLYRATSAPCFAALRLCSSPSSLAHRRSDDPPPHTHTLLPHLPPQTQLRIIERDKQAAAAKAASAAKNADVFGDLPLVQSASITGRVWSR